MDKKVAILVSGHARGYFSFLHSFLMRLPPNFHIYLHFSSNDSDRFFHLKQIENVSDPKIKAIFYGDLKDDFGSRNTREINTLQQWHKIKSLFEKLDSTFDVIVRCRTDVCFDCDHEAFLRIITSVTNDAILIPTGYDVFDTRAVPSSLHTECINDQIAIGTFNTMKHYCGLYDVVKSTMSPVISEHCLFSHLHRLHIPIHRVDLPYHLVLSKVFSISICGDSGSGKSKLAELLQQTLFFDNSLIFETDRYHKWERGSEHYKTYTHLHPYANHLEKMSEDAYRLCLGDSLHLIDYDHETGKFTSPQPVEPKPVIVFCGLHTLYQKHMRDLTDLKIYLDTQTSLRISWKVSRDAATRGATEESVKNSIELRKKDTVYLTEQSKYADLILQYFEKDHELAIRFLLRKEKFSSLHSIFSLITIEYECDDFVHFRVALPSLPFILPSGVCLNTDCSGLIQLVIAKLLWNF